MTDSYRKSNIKGFENLKASITITCMSLFTSRKPSIFPETPRKWNPLKSWSNDIIAWTHFQIVLQVPVFGPRFAPYFNVTDVSVADNSHLVQCAILCLLDLPSLYLCNSKTIWAKCCPCCPIVIVVSNLLSCSCQFSLICLMSVLFLWSLFLLQKKRYLLGCIVSESHIIRRVLSAHWIAACALVNSPLRHWFNLLVANFKNFLPSFNVFLAVCFYLTMCVQI